MTRSRSSARQPQDRHLADRSQRERFIETARELGCDEDEEAFKAKLKRIAKSAAKPATTKGTRAKTQSKG
jgi:hypothetical protein